MTTTGKSGMDNRLIGLLLAGMSFLAAVCCANAATPEARKERIEAVEAGATPDARDRREFTRMGAEKVAAFQQSWWQMGVAALAAQQRVALAMMSGNPARVAQALARAGTDVAAQGLAPVSRRATANAKRLRKTPLRPGKR